MQHMTIHHATKINHIHTYSYTIFPKVSRVSISTGGYKNKYCFLLGNITETFVFGTLEIKAKVNPIHNDFVSTFSIVF